MNAADKEEKILRHFEENPTISNSMVAGRFEMVPVQVNEKVDSMGS